MKFLLSQPANLRFRWELDVCLTNIRQFTDLPIVLLFLEEDPSVLTHFHNRYPNLEIHHYPDTRRNKSYIPTIKPFLVWKYLEEHPVLEDYFYIDSDVIFRALPDFSQIPMDGLVAYGSDCGGYLNYDYLSTRSNADWVLESISQAASIPVEDIKKLPGAGAQWLIHHPTAGLFKTICQDSQKIWDAIEPIETNLQKWTAEMWATIYGLHKHGYTVKTHPELDFCRPTDDIKMWDMVKILHNAGVVDEGPAGLFFKSKYVNHTPFNEDLSWVRKDRCSIHYIDAIRKVV